jgi:hypothetical protein
MQHMYFPLQMNAVFWDVSPCGSCKKRRFGRTCHLYHQGDKNRRARNKVNINLQFNSNYIVFLRIVLRFLVTANVPSSPIFVIMMMEAIHSSPSSVLTRATRRNFPKDNIIHSHCREIKSDSTNRLGSVAET